MTRLEGAWQEFRAGHGWVPATMRHHERQVFMSGYRAGKARRGQDLARAAVVAVVLLLAARRRR